MWRTKELEVFLLGVYFLIQTQRSFFYCPFTTSHIQNECIRQSAQQHCQQNKARLQKALPMSDIFSWYLHGNFGKLSWGRVPPTKCSYRIQALMLIRTRNVSVKREFRTISTPSPDLSWKDAASDCRSANSEPKGVSQQAPAHDAAYQTRLPHASYAALSRENCKKASDTPWAQLSFCNWRATEVFAKLSLQNHVCEQDSYK